MQRGQSLAINAAENIDVTVGPGNGLLVQVTGNDCADGTVNFQATIDGANFTNTPYEQSRVASPSRSIAQISSPTTLTEYIIVPPVSQVRIAVGADSACGSIDIRYREVGVPFDPTSAAAADAFLASVGGALADAAATGAVTSVDTLVSYVKQLVTNQRAIVHHMDFWSDLQATVTITATAADLALPDVIVAGLPTGATVTRAIGMFKYRTAEDSSAADNKIDDGAGATTPAIQVRADTPGTYIDAINVIDSTVAVTASTIEGGDVWIGDNDVKSEVAGNDTYNFQFDDAEADGANLILNDVQTGLRVYYTIE